MSMYPRAPGVRLTLPGTCTIACDVWPGEEDDIYAHAPICRKEYIGHLEIALSAERSQLAALIAALESRASDLEKGTLFGPVAAMSIRSVLARVAPAATKQAATDRQRIEALEAALRDIGVLVDDAHDWCPGDWPSGNDVHSTVCLRARLVRPAGSPDAAPTICRQCAGEVGAGPCVCPEGQEANDASSV